MCSNIVKCDFDEAQKKQKSSLIFLNPIVASFNNLFTAAFNLLYTSLPFTVQSVLFTVYILLFSAAFDLFSNLSARHPAHLNNPHILTLCQPRTNAVATNCSEPQLKITFSWKQCFILAHSRCRNQGQMLLPLIFPLANSRCKSIFMQQGICFQL